MLDRLPSSRGEDLKHVWNQHSSSYISLSCCLQSFGGMESTSGYIYIYIEKTTLQFPDHLQRFSEFAVYKDDQHPPSLYTNSIMNELQRP